MKSKRNFKKTKQKIYLVKSTVHINVPHTYFLIIVLEVDNTIHHINKYPVDSLVCSASTTANHWKAIYYVDSVFYSHKN